MIKMQQLPKKFKEIDNPRFRMNQTSFQKLLIDKKVNILRSFQWNLPVINFPIYKTLNDVKNPRLLRIIGSNIRDMGDHEIFSISNLPAICLALQPYREIFLSQFCNMGKASSAKLAAFKFHLWSSLKI